MSVPNVDQLTIRWTIGDVRDRGFEMLRLSIACAFRLFGPAAHYVVCVNSLSPTDARAKTGSLPVEPEWLGVTRADVPRILRPHFDHGLMEGMAWKLVPLRIHPERFELALDNDCILWSLPAAIERWLASAEGTVFAEDVDRCLGSFDAMCPPGCFNAGIRGLVPGETLQPALAQVLQQAEGASGDPVQLTAEIEEQGLQAAAIWRLNPVYLVKNSEVSICSPFWPRSPELGSCGAHFVGMNAPHVPWDYYDRPGDAWLDEHWERHRPELYKAAALALPS